MKKILGIVFILLACLVSVSAIVFAAEQQESEHTLRDVYAYKIIGRNYKDVNADILNYFGTRATESIIPEVDYAYVKARTPNSHYFIKIYPAYKDTNMFIVSDEKYNKETNPMTKAFKAMSYQYTELLDKEAIGEYQEDFVNYVRKDYLKDFFVLPDYLKSVKSGVSKATTSLKKKKKTAVALPYKNEDVQINLTCIDENNYKDYDNGVSINSKEYRLKYKANKYAHAFQYTIYNNGNTDLVVNKIKGQSVANIADLEATSLIDLDRVDALSWAAIFPPVLVATCGASVLLKAPAYYRNVRVAEEVTRYAKSFPENYKIPAHSNIKFTAIQYKEQRKPLDFKFTRSGASFDVAF